MARPRDTPGDWLCDVVKLSPVSNIGEGAREEAAGLQAGARDFDVGQVWFLHSFTPAARHHTRTNKANLVDDTPGNGDPV